MKKLAVIFSIILSLLIVRGVFAENILQDNFIINRITKLIRLSTYFNQFLIGDTTTSTDYILEVHDDIWADDSIRANQFCINTTTPDCIDAWSDVGGGATGNPFDQWLDSTSTVQFKTITVSSTAEFADSVIRKSSITDALLGSSGFLYYSGKYIYQSGLGSDTLTIFNVNDPENPKKVGQLTNGALFDAIEKMVLVGKYLYVVAMNSNSFVVVDVSDVTKPKIVSSIVDATLLNGAEFVTISGRYAYVGVTNGDRITIVDIADPINPKIVGSVYDATNLNGVIYIAVSGKYLYATASSGGRLAIVDASDVTNPRVVGAAATGSGAGTVAVRGRYAYVTGYANPTFHIYDVASSTNPTKVNTLTDAASFDDYALTVKLSGKYAFMTIYGGTPGIAMIDITSSSTMPSVAYKITDAAFSGLDDLTIVGGYIYATDNTGKKLHIIKIPGVVAPSIETGNIYTDKLNVDGEAILDGVLQVKDGITTGGGLFSMGSIASNSSLYASTTLAVATTTPWAGYQLVVNGNSLLYGNATTTGTIDASQYCISGGNCISAWPAGGGGSGDGVWVITANGIYNATNTDTVVLGTNAIADVANTLEVTGDSLFTGDIVVGGYATTTLGLFTQGTGHIGGNLTVDGSATTTGHLAALGGNSDQWNTAYLWGNHATAGYFSLSDWFSTTTHANISSLPSLSITESQISDLSHYTDADTGDYIDASTTIQTYFSNAATAFSWGNHAVAGYFSLTDWFSTTTHANISSLPSLSITESQISDLSHYTDADTGDYIDASTTIQTYFSNAATAFSWGNHATAGYLSSSLAASTYLSLTDWFATTTWAGGNSLSVATTLSVATSTPWSGYELAVTGDGVFTGDLYVMGNATSSHFAASEICLNGTCRTTWPTDAGAVTFWEYAWDKTITTTSTDIGLFVTASSTVAADFRVDGDLTTTGKIYAGSSLYLGHSSKNDNDYLYFDAGAEYLVWNNTSDLFVLSNGLSVTGYATTTAGLFTQGNLRVGRNAVIDGSVSATQYCLSGDCITAWPSGATAAYPINQWLDTTNTPIFAGLRLTGLSDPAGSFLAVDPDGDLIATTTPSLWSTHANGIYYNSGKVGIGTTPDSSTGLTVHGGISSPMGDDLYNEAFGKNAYIDDTAFKNTTVIGYGASARSGFAKGGNTVIGAWATSTHAANTIIGSRSRSSAGYSVVIGSDLSANSANSVLIGSNAQISNGATAAIGFSTVADENHSVAIGQGVNTDKQNQFVFGTRMKANAAPVFTLQGAVKAYTPRNVFEIITEWLDLTDETRQARVKFLTGDYTGALEFMRAETKGGKVDVSLTDNFYVGGNATTTGSHEFTTEDGAHGLRIIPGSTTTTLDFF